MNCVLYTSLGGFVICFAVDVFTLDLPGVGLWKFIKTRITVDADRERPQELGPEVQRKLRNSV
jgi:hypothetical protein